MASNTPKPALKVRGVYEHPVGSDIWWCQYFEHGKRHRERVGRRSDAITLYRKRKTEILRGEKLPELGRKRVTLGDLLDDALAFAREHGRLLRNYEGNAERLREAFGTRAAEEITPREFSAWINARDISSATFNRYRSFLSLCYREGNRNGIIATNPARLLAYRKEPRGRQRFLNRAYEFPKLLERIEELSHVRARAFRFSIYSGARLGEQFHLRWPQVDFHQREVTFLDTKNGEDRTIPMNQVMLQVLEELREERKSHKSKEPVFGDLREFCCDLGASLQEGVGETGYSPKWFKETCEALEISDYTWHNNRHTFCSWLAIDGASLKEIQVLAGHKSIQTTARYAHLSPDNKRSVMDRLVTPLRPSPTEITTATRTAIA